MDDTKIGTVKDRYNESVQVFVPRSGKQLTTPYTPTLDEVVKLNTAVTITIDSIAVDYLAGDIIGLDKGVTYTLSAATDVHMM